MKEKKNDLYMVIRVLCPDIKSVIYGEWKCLYTVYCTYNNIYLPYLTFLIFSIN